MPYYYFYKGAVTGFFKATSDKRPLGVSIIAAISALIAIASFILIFYKTGMTLYDPLLIVIPLPFLLIVYGLYEGINKIRIIIVVVAALIILETLQLITGVYYSTTGPGQGNGLLPWYTLGIVVIASLAYLIYYLAAKKSVNDFFMLGAAKNRYKSLAISATIIIILLMIIIVAQLPSASPTLGTACVVQAGFLCQSPIILSTNGNLSFVFGQSTRATVYNVGLACAATSTSAAGLPNPPTSMVLIDGSLGFATNNGAYGTNVLANTLTLISGGTITVSKLKCFGTTANALTNQPIGSAFSGAIYINYTKRNGVPGGSNPWLMRKMAIVTLKVV